MSSQPVSSDSAGGKGEGYANNRVATSSSATLGALDERNSPADDPAGPSGNEDSSRVLENNDVEEVGINVDFTGAWDGRPKKWPIVADYDLAPHEGKQITSSFHSGPPLKELNRGLGLVKVAKDADYFKIAVCRMTERACHGWEGYALDFFYAYSTLFKDLKVVILEAGRPSFYFPNGQPKFPFYWTDRPKKVVSWPKSRMTPNELDLIRQLNYLTKMDKGASSTFARIMASKQTELKKSVPPTQPPPPNLEAQTTALTRPTIVAIKKVVEAIHIFSDLTQKKKKNKRKAARELSVSSKRSRRALPNSAPLSGPVDPSLWVAKHIDFDLFIEEKGFVKGMTEEEASNMAFDLAARSTMCVAYAVEKKATTSIEIQALQEKYDKAMKSNKDLTLRLAEVEKMPEDDKNKANTLLVESRSFHPKLQRSNDDLKLDLLRFTEKGKELIAERDNLLSKWDSLRDNVQKLEDENKFLGEEVINEHVLDFEKAFSQCNLLYHVPLDDSRFNVMKMIVNGELVPIPVPETLAPTVEATQPPLVIEVIVEIDGANA
ncbi:hypothetical protein LR48_Vigan10g185000 [Vigna angularis]|uniref:Uncharacterized protein n=1 Tax=Phaseolus angularis TaxID=3914 RepID=A0A0L9VLX2_PHAAN|nr:hypothetical protein LR48_Vigan10g185000 [Vigna angularis]